MSKLAAVSCFAVLLLLWSAVANAAVGEFNCFTTAECTEAARHFLDDLYEVRARPLMEEETQKDWEYETNVNEDTSNAADAAKSKMATFEKDMWQQYTSLFNLSLVADARNRRRLKQMSVLGTAALPKENHAELLSLISSMTSIYSSARICPWEVRGTDCVLDNQGLTLEPGIETVMSNPLGRTYQELAYTWQAWRDASGKRMRQAYLDYVSLNNQAARANGFSDASQLWLVPYTQDLPPGSDFRQDLEVLWQELRPFYLKLHTYIRWKYSQKWGEDKVDLNKPIPAHLTGNMWAQEWGDSYAAVEPFPGVPNPIDEVTPRLRSEDKTASDLFDMSNQFYLSLGLADMRMCYDTQCRQENSPDNVRCHAQKPMIVKPDWDVVCHASAWDMYHLDKKDYRVKMCTEVNFGDLVTIHHEMGHIQYFIQYKNQPLQFRSGANNGFHEAIGDTMALSVQTPLHLQSIGLLGEVASSTKSDINYLMRSAMDKIIFLPFGYLIDQFRWGLFDGSIRPDEMNYKWWQLREKYQGIVPPVKRSELDFDAGAKFHVPADVPYIRYFVARILEFQFYRQMCLDSGQFDPKDPAGRPLFQCDFSRGSKAVTAGRRMKEMLQKGSSQPWPATLADYTGSPKISAAAILDYYKPLIHFLDQEITKNNLRLGWDSTIDSWF